MRRTTCEHVPMIAHLQLPFLTRGAKEISAHPKYSIINFATGIELMLKARLMKEHWSLVVEKSGDAVKKDFLEGRSRTVTPKEAMKRLRNVCNEPVPEEAQRAFEGIADHRNKVMHFFHEAASEDASPDLLEAVTKEQFLCWYFLKQLIIGWGAPFDDYPGDLYRINAFMKDNRAYLQAVYEREKPEIEKAENAGVKYQDCSGCGFHAALVEDLDDMIQEQECRVCSLAERHITIGCPTKCGSSVRMLADIGSKRVCPSCAHDVTTSDISEALDTEYFDSGMSSPGKNCAYCGGHNTVVEHNDFYVCTDCLSAIKDIEYCEWCSEGQIGGGDLEHSYYSGCEFCEGKGGWEKD